MGLGCRHQSTPKVIPITRLMMSSFMERTIISLKRIDAIRQVFFCLHGSLKTDRYVEYLAI